jgi:hypothetical protein
VGRCRKVKSEEEKREGVAGKAAGDECVFIPGEGSGATPMPDAAGGEGVPGSLNRKG